LVRLNITSDRVEISVINSSSSGTARGGGRGLRGAAKSLAGFGGSLEVLSPVPAGWTYGIKIVLDRWKWN
jgi:hypothetical protein